MNENYRKLLTLFYTTEENNIELAYLLAKNTNCNKFIHFYRQWQEILNFYHIYKNPSYCIATVLNEIEVNGIDFTNLKLNFLPTCFKVTADICTKVYLKLNVFTELPLVLKYLYKLKIINISANEIVKLPKWLFGLSQLEFLDLNYNPISYLNASFSKLTNLKTLNIVSSAHKVVLSKKTVLPAQLSRLEIGFLNLKQKKTAFLEAILNQKQLKQLVLSNIDLKFNINKLVGLVSLENLEITNCKVENWDIKIEKWQGLKQLSLNNCNLQYIPDFVFSISDLEYLDLANNAIETLPATFSILKQLKILFLKNNCIDSRSTEYWDSQLRRWQPNLEVHWGLF